MEFLDSQTQPKKQPTHENQTQPKKFTMLCQWHGVGSESMVALRAMRVRLSGVREEVSGRVKVILIIITLRKWVSSIGIFYSCFSNEELQLQRVSWRSRSRRRVLSCFGLKFELVSGGVYQGDIGKWCYASNVAMQFEFSWPPTSLHKFDSSVHNSSALCFSLSSPFIFSLSDLGCACPNLGSRSTT